MELQGAGGSRPRVLIEAPGGAALTARDPFAGVVLERRPRRGRPPLGAGPVALRLARLLVAGECLLDLLAAMRGHEHVGALTAALAGAVRNVPPIVRAIEVPGHPGTR